MNMETKHEVLKAYWEEWLSIRGNKIKRGLLTKQLAKSTKLHPKSIGRSMRTLQMRSTRKSVHKKGVNEGDVLFVRWLRERR